MPDGGLQAPKQDLEHIREVLQIASQSVAIQMSAETGLDIRVGTVYLATQIDPGSAAIATFTLAGKPFIAVLLFRDNGGRWIPMPETFQ